MLQDTDKRFVCWLQRPEGKRERGLYIIVRTVSLCRTLAVASYLNLCRRQLSMSNGGKRKKHSVAAAVAPCSSPSWGSTDTTKLYNHCGTCQFLNSFRNEHSAHLAQLIGDVSTRCDLLASYVQLAVGSLCGSVGSRVASIGLQC